MSPGAGQGRGGWRAVASLLLLGGGGCFLAEILSPAGLPERFNHRIHVEEAELECAGCHALAEEEDAAGMPRMGKCRKCHDEEDGEGPGRELAGRFGDPPVWTQVTAMPEEVVFSHRVHAGGGVDCATCHSGIRGSVRVSEELRVTMERCVACHSERGVGTDCAVCHAEIRRESPPPGHDRAWRRLHGAVALDEGLGGGKRCTLCHTDSSCAGCHRSEPPANHTNQWRQAGHSVAAGTDRRSCTVCHEAGACERCHQETAPRSHRASWGSPRDLHCAACHFPLDPSGCGFCHRGGTPSHSLAPPRPGDLPHAGTVEADCRTCHTPLTMTHPDNGACTGCH